MFQHLTLWEPNPEYHGGRCHMLFGNKNTLLKDVPWYVYLGYLLAIIVFFVLLLKHVWWYFAAANLLFFASGLLLNRAKKRRAESQQTLGESQGVRSQPSR